MNKRQILLEHYLIEVLIQDYFQSKGILLENQLDEGKLKDFIKSVKDNFKSSLRPKFNNLLKGLEITGKPATAISFLSTLKNLDIDLTNKKEVAAAVAYLKNKTKLKEAEGDVVEKDGKKFIETIDPFSGQTLLVPEKDYEGVGIKLEKGGSSVIGKLSKFFNDARLGKVLKGVLIAAPLFAGLADEIGDTAEQAGEAVGLGDLNITGNDAPSQETIRGLMNAGFSSDQISDYLDSQFAVDTGGQTGGIIDDVEGALEGDIDTADLATDTDEVSDAKNQGLDISPTGGETVNFTNFELGSSQLDPADESKLSTENSTIIKFLQNGQDYGETVLGVASNTGPNSNVDDQGGDLNTNRLNNTADFILDDLESQLKDQGVDYTRSGDTIQVEGGGSYSLDRSGVNDPGALNQIDRTNDTATQSAIRVGSAGDPPEPTRLFGFDPVRPEETPPAKPGEPKPDDEKEEIVPLPSEVEIIYPGNRLHQYAMISQLMNGIDFFKTIGATQDPSGKRLTDAVLSGDNTGIVIYRSGYEDDGPDDNLTKQIYAKTLKNLVTQGWGEDDAKNLLARVATLKEGEKIQGIASWIMMSRKQPDKIINYLNGKFPGLDIGQRDKAFFVINEKSEEYIRFKTRQKLLEFLIVNKTEQLPDLDESLVKQNLAQIVGLVTSMYFDAKKGGPLSYNDDYLKENAPDYNKMKKFVRLVGKNYGVMDLDGYDPSGLTPGKVLAGQPQALSGPGGGKKEVPKLPFDKNPDNKIEPDVAKVKDLVDDNSTIKKRLALINTKEELIQVIVFISSEFVKTNDKVATAALKTAYPRINIRPGRHLASFRHNRRSLREFIDIIYEKQLSFDFDGDGDPAPLPQDVEKDVVGLGQALKTVGAFKSLVSRITTKEELIELILNVIFPNVNPTLQKQPTAMRDAILKATEILKKGNVNEINEMSKKKIRQRDKLAKSIKPRTIKQYGKKEGESAAYAIATNMVKEDCGCGCNDCNHTPMEHTINELICDLVYEELCKRGKAYIAARKRAGEKSSAYLSGRAVKVCKGQIKGVGGKRKKSYRRKNESLYNQLKPQVLNHLEELFNDPHFAIVAEYNVEEANIDESLRDWFKKENWVRIDTQGNIAGKCGTMPKGKATQRCLPRAKAMSLTKAQRRATARKKVRGSKKGKQFVRNTKKARVSFKKK